MMRFILYIFFSFVSICPAKSQSVLDIWADKAGIPVQFFDKVVNPYDSETLYWQTRVIANGSTVSTATLNAVNQFVLDVASIRDSLLRVNLYCGDNLNACLVPLFFNADKSTTPLGGYRDTNYNFIAGDYTEATGLTGDSLTKYTSTGFIPASISQIGQNSAHISIYYLTNGIGVGLGYTNATNSFYIIPSFTDGKYYSRIFSGGTAITNAYANTSGYWISSRIASDSIFYDKNGAYFGKQAQVSSAKQSLRVFIHACNEINGTPKFFTKASIIGYTTGRGLNASQRLILANAMNSFQTKMGRNTY